MDDKHALALATAKYQASVIPFAQKHDEPWCRAISANWLRRHARGKQLFSEKSKSVEPVLAAGQVVAWQVRYDDAAARIHEVHNAVWNQPHRLHGVFKDDPVQQGQQAILDDRAGNKFQQMAVLFKFGAEAGVLEDQYIRKGGFKHRDAPGQVNKPELQRLHAGARVKMTKDADTFIQLLWVLRKQACLATIGFDRLACSHQIAISFSDPLAVYYFDPLLGELKFKGVKDLAQWWEACYLDRCSEDKATCTLDREGLPTSAFFTLVQYKPESTTAEATAYKPIGVGTHPALKDRSLI